MFDLPSRARWGYRDAVKPVQPGEAPKPRASAARKSKLKFATPYNWRAGFFRLFKPDPSGFSLDTFDRPIIDWTRPVTNTQRRQTQSIGSKQTRLRRCAGYITCFPPNLQMGGSWAATEKCSGCVREQHSEIRRASLLRPRETVTAPDEPGA